MKTIRIAILGLVAGILLGCNPNASSEAKQDDVILSTQLEQVGKDRNQWQEKCEKLESEIGDLKAREKTAQEKLAKAQGDLSDLKKRLSDQAATLEKSREDLNAADTKLSQQQSELERVRSQLKKSQQQVDDLEKANGELEKQIAEAKAKGATHSTTAPTDSKP